MVEQRDTAPSGVGIKMFILVQENGESNALTVYQRLVTWADMEIIRLLKKKRSSSLRRGKKLMGAADATLLANPR